MGFDNFSARSAEKWPDLQAMQSDYDQKKGSNEAAFAHQFRCIATKSCNEYENNGNSGWGGEFVKFMFDYTIQEDGLTDSLKVTVVFLARHQIAYFRLLQ